MSKIPKNETHNNESYIPKSNITNQSRNRARNSSMKAFGNAYPTNFSNNLKKKTSLVDLNRNNSMKEFLNFYQTNKKDPNFIKNRNSFIRQKVKNVNNHKMILVQDLYIINETLSQHTEKLLFNNKYRCFLGKDIIDKIYFCPNDNIIFLNYEEANKIGVLFLELLRYEKELVDYEFLFKHISVKYNEECENLQNEKERIYEE